MSEALDFDARGVEFVREIPVKYKGVEYVLRSADAEASVTYENAQMRYQIYDPASGKYVQGDIANVQPLLVSLCLWHGDERVTEKTVRGWPAPVMIELYEKAQEISHLDGRVTSESLRSHISKLQDLLKRVEDQEQKVKNSSGGTPSGS